MSHAPLTPISRFSMVGSRSISDAVSRKSDPSAIGSCRSARGRANISMSCTIRFEPVEPRDDVHQNRAIALLGGHPRGDHLQRAANTRDGVLDLVRDHRGHLAELCERFLFRQPLLEHDTVAQIVKNAREAASAVL